MANQERLSRWNLFEGVVIGIYGNWLISFLDKITFEKVMVWYQPLCVGVSFASLLMLFSFSIFRPNLVTRWFGFMMGFAHAIGNYGALWAEGLPQLPQNIDLNVFFWVGVALFGIIYVIELQRIREAGNARARAHIDFTNKTITVRTAKGGLGRIVKLKDDTIAKLKDYIGNRKLGLNDRLYPSSVAMGVMWRHARKRAIEKTKLLELESIRLYDLRHLHATMLYNRTKDLLFVKQQLGHRNINSTLRYTQLINFHSEEYSVKVANNLEECTNLLESGFEYFTDYENKKVFRKRK